MMLLKKSLIVVIIICTTLNIAYGVLATETKYTQAEEILISYGITDGKSQTEKSVSYAEFVVMVMRSMGYENIINVHNAGHWAENYMECARNTGALVNVGEIGYDEIISTETAIKIVINALGYGASVKNSSYMATAGKVGLLSHVSMENILIRANAYVLLYNALNTDNMVYCGGPNGQYKIDIGNTWESTLRKITDRRYITGIVEGNDRTSFTGDELDKDTIMIENNIYNVGQSNAYDYLGYNVGFFADFSKSEDRGTIVMVWPLEEKNNIIEVDSQDIMSYDTSTIRYSNGKNGKSLSAKVSQNAYFVYNGGLVTSILGNIIDDENAKYKFIDNNGDKIYDIIWEEKIETHIVDKVVYENGLIVFKPICENERKSIEIDLDDDEKSYQFYNSNNEIVTLKDISTGCVLSLAESYDKKLLTVYIVEDAEIDSVATQLDKNDKTVVIDSEEYEYTNDLEIDINVTGKFYKDILGRIFYFTEERDSFVYVVKKYYENKIGKKAEIKVLTTNQQLCEYSLSDNVKIDGVKYKNKADAICAVTEKGVSRIKIDRNGEVSELESSSIYSENGKRIWHEYALGFNDVKFDYDPIEISEKTNVFYIPESGKDEDFESLFLMEDGGEYTCTSYGWNEIEKYVDAVVVTLDCDEPLNNGYSTSMNLLAVNKVYCKLIDGTYTYVVEGIHNGEEVTFFAADRQDVYNILAMTEKGDVIQYVLNWDGEIVLAKIVLDYSTLSESFVSDLGGSSEKIYGKVSEFDENVLTNNYSYRVNKLVFSIDGKNISKYVSSSENGTEDSSDKGFKNYCLFDKKNKMYYVADVNNIVTEELGEDGVTDVFVYSRFNTVSFIGIFK